MRPSPVAPGEGQAPSHPPIKQDWKTVPILVPNRRFIHWPRLTHRQLVTNWDSLHGSNQQSHMRAETALPVAGRR